MGPSRCSDRSCAQTVVAPKRLTCSVGNESGLRARRRPLRTSRRPRDARHPRAVRGIRPARDAAQMVQSPQRVTRGPSPRRAPRTCGRVSRWSRSRRRRRCHVSGSRRPGRPKGLRCPSRPRPTRRRRADPPPRDPWSPSRRRRSGRGPTRRSRCRIRQSLPRASTSRSGRQCRSGRRASCGSSPTRSRARRGRAQANARPATIPPGVPLAGVRPARAPYANPPRAIVLPARRPRASAPRPSVLPADLFLATRLPANVPHAHAPPGRRRRANGRPGGRAP